MNGVRKILAAASFGLLAMIATADPAHAQSAVAFAPTIGTIPDGAILNVTPVVSADRRYVRMSLNPQFTGVIRFDNFNIPAAVTGGGGFGGGGGGLGGLGGFGGGGGGVGGGFRNMAPGEAALSGFVDSNPLSSFAIVTPEDLAPQVPKATKGRRTSSRPPAMVRTGPKRRVR
ncbi:MAG: type secretory pathway, component PulD [Planctomycetota bacterium]|nr:type secretory pathway, component PulD [Planctomycetota bacterium]